MRLSQPLPKPTTILGYAVHVYTASGVIFALLAMIEVLSPACEPRWVFVWLAITLVIDATDGPLARRCHIKHTAPRIDGRTIDDILDYLTFTFIPLMLIWRMGWLGPPIGLWVGLAMLVSLLGFANTQAKEEDEGFFRGFPSCWNVIAYYAGPATIFVSPWLATGLLIMFTALTLAPFRVVYINLAPPPWRRALMISGMLWLVLLLVMLPWYPTPPGWLVLISLVYPLGYWAISIHLDIKRHKRRAKSREQGSESRDQERT